MDIVEAGAHRDGICTGGDGPLLRDDVPVAEVTAEQAEGDIRAGARGDVDLLEAAEDAAGLIGGGGEAEVQLGDLGTVDGAGVADAGGHADDLVPHVGVAAEGEDAGGVGGREGGAVGHGGGGGGGVVEGGVGETVAEGVQDRDVVGGEVAVVEVDTLGEVAVGSVADVDGVVGGVLDQGVG